MPDVSARGPGSNAADALDSERLFRLAVEASPNGVLVIDAEGVVRFANNQAESLFGYPAGALVGLPFQTLVPGAVSDRDASLRRAFLPTDSNLPVNAAHDLPGRRQDGSEVPVEVALTAVPVGSRVFVLAAVVDLSERRRLEERARDAANDRARFEALVADISAAFVNLPPDRVDTAIVDALQRIVEALDLDRAVLWLRDGDDFHPEHRWARSGVPLTNERLSVKALFPLGWSLLSAGEDFVYQRVDDVPDPVSRETIVRFGAKAGASVPFSIDGQVAGLVAFASTRREQAWPEDLLGRLRLVTGVFANAIVRQRHDQSLASVLAEVRRLGEQLQAENAFLRREVRQVLGTSPVVGQSAPMAQALELVSQVAPTDSSVLLLGETGSGKELFASQIHDLSPRRDRLMVRVNCAAIPATLLESELFGREKGAYTGALSRQVGRFELADKSTIFLDEIGDLSLDVQVKLLRVLEDRQVERLGSSRAVQVDVRIIAATHRELEKMVAAGTFREDLYYRLNVFPIRVPPLRERPEDIPLLVWRFVDEFSKRFGKDIESIGKECMQELQRYAWPGNVRELRNVVERAMIVARPGRLAISPPQPPAGAPQPKSARLTDVEAAHIRSVLDSTGWRIRGAGGAAERLDMKPSTLETRMAKLGIRRPAGR
jgi:PAS domain S-box-containing protein